MPRNRSEKSPKFLLTAELEPLRDIIRANAQGCLDRGSTVESVRNRSSMWASRAGNDEFAVMPTEQRHAWSNLRNEVRRALVARHMEFLDAQK